MKTMQMIVMTVFMLSLVACNSPTPAPTATNTATLVPTSTITFTPTPLPTLTPTPTDSPTITPTVPPTDTPTPTLTFTPSPMPTPEATSYFTLTIVNNSGQPITMKLESKAKPGTGYEFTILPGETKEFKIAKGPYKRTTWACGGRMSSGSLNMTGNYQLNFLPCQ